MNGMTDDEKRILRLWPVPPESTTDKLKHVLDVFDGFGDNEKMVTATNYVYGHGVRTGLTLGDLRELLKLVEGKSL